MVEKHTLKLSGLKNVLDIVVPADMCIGCGVCAGVCPVGSLEMKMIHGEYKPFLIGKCLPNCHLCLVSCPFYDHESHHYDLATSCFHQETEIKQDPAVGYYIDAYIGYSNVNGQRERGASGGMVTWLLERLFNTGEIDRVVAVQPRLDGNAPLFEFSVLDSVTAIRKVSGSRYYPVEISKPLRLIRMDKANHRYAIVGLPCLVKGVRRAMEQNGNLRKRIVYLIGLTCGLCPSAYYTEVLSAWAGVAPANVRTAGYRFKEGSKCGQDYGFRAQRHDGTWSRQVGFIETYGHIWGRYYFCHNACNFCDDVYAELADAGFMDAWLPSLLSDTQGTSIIVIRNSRLRDILVTGIQQGTCILERCSIEDVKNSQDAQIFEKKIAIRQRIAVVQGEGKWVPKMRIQGDATENVSPVELKRIVCRFRTIRGSKIIWRYFRRLPPSILPFFFMLVDSYASGLTYGVKSFIRIAKKRLSKKEMGE